MYHVHTEWIWPTTKHQCRKSITQNKSGIKQILTSSFEIDWNKREREKSRKKINLSLSFSIVTVVVAHSLKILCIVFFSSVFRFSSLLVSFSLCATITCVLTLALLLYFISIIFFSSSTLLLLFSGPDFQFTLNGLVTRFIFSIHFVIFSLLFL